MKVFGNIELFHRKKGIIGDVVVSDEEFRKGLTDIINAVVPLRKDKEKCISVYVKTRDGHALTTSLAETESLWPSFDLGRKAVDLAVLKVIYHDRYSFGHLYWYLLSSYENEAVLIDEFVDPEAPYYKGLIEYAVDYDLAKTVEEYESIPNLYDRYEYALGCLRRSQSEVLIKHQIKNDYEDAVSLLVEECRALLNDLDLAISEEGSDAVTQASTTEEGASNLRSAGDTPFAINYVIDPKNRAKLLDYLHTRIEGKQNQHALVYIQAAIDASLLKMPEYLDVIEEFGDICEKSNYYGLVAPLDPSHPVVGGKFKQKLRAVQQAVKELQEMFK